MALPSTPKNQFVTPRKGRMFKTPLDPDTPKNLPVTPRIIRNGSIPTTPECFNIVTLETPNSAIKKRASKEKFDEISNLTVAVRIRPMNARELACVGSSDIVTVKEQDLIIRSNPLGNSLMSLDHVFQYDHIFWSCDETKPMFATQEDVFMTIGKPLLNSAFRGYNACLFAYGQTGSGKSFSMMGPSNSEVADIDSEQFSGVTPRFCRDLFDRIARLQPKCAVSVEVSYFEIYNEKIHDLLATDSTNRVALKVREHPELGPHVVDLSIQSVKSYKELRNLLILGNKNRATAATTMNENSSRSHSIFCIELNLSDNVTDCDSSRRSKVSLVDLAGSERLSSSHNSEEKIRQGVSINKSLLTLGKVISALADQKKSQFVPYRESVLTWLLKESLGGNSLTCMLATITPANTNLEETLATLRYACQARTIVNRARINENPHDRLIRELKLEVQRLKALKQDYERNSVLSSSLNSLNNSNNEEMEELRNKLMNAEEHLSNAEKSWNRRLIESTQVQLRELAESEKRREQLESEIRVMRTLDTNIDMSLYKTSFLQELEEVLTEDFTEECDDAVRLIVDWCSKNQMQYTFKSSAITIINTKGNKQTILAINDSKKVYDFNNVSDFLQTLKWTESRKNIKQLSKSDILSSFKEIYQLLNSLQPCEDDNNLNLLFAKVNKSMQSFESAVLNNFSKNNHKTVSFNL